MKYISYIRVSTNKQEDTGLGIDDQKRTIERFLKKDDSIINEYIEIESGRNPNRPKVKQAIEECKKTGATLLIARLDRLARSVSFTSLLQDTKVPFLAIDIPGASHLIINIFSAMAQNEAENISKNTRAALASLKRNGVVLGKPENFSDEGRLKGAAAMNKNAKDNLHNRRAYPLAEALIENKMTLRQVADKLNKSGYTTPRGCEYTATSVKNLIKLYND